MSSTNTGPSPDPSATPPSSVGAGQTDPPSSGGILVVDEVTLDEEAVLSKIGHAWWLVLILGIVSVAAGIFVLVYPFGAVRIAAFVFGIWLLVSGIFQLVQAFDKRLETTARVLAVISGVLGIVLGIICFKSVQDRIELLILFIGIWWIMRGIMQLILGAGKNGSGFSIFLGLLGIVAGIIVLVYPISSLSVLVILAGIWLLVLGVFEIIASFRVKSINSKTA